MTTTTEAQPSKPQPPRVIVRDAVASTWGPHPARRMPVDDLRNGLLAECAAGNIRRVVLDDLELYLYTQKCVYERNWNIWTLMARGLVLGPDGVLATPFPKFFNYGEAQLWGADAVPGTITVTEKLDGSMGILFHDGSRWRICTKGSFGSEQSQWAEAWCAKHMVAVRVRGWTYVLEIVYPANQIVVKYDWEGCALLAAYRPDGVEEPLRNVQAMAEILGCRCPTSQPYTSAEALADAASRLDSYQEGWVIRFANGHRLKIKGAEYCRLHRVISCVTPLGVWALMLAGDDLSAVRRDLPEEHQRDFDRIVELLGARAASRVDRIRLLYEATRDLDDRACGLALRDELRAQDPMAAKFVFPCRKHDFLTRWTIPGEPLREKLFKTFRPARNQLDGYAPSSAATRFAREETQ